MRKMFSEKQIKNLSWESVSEDHAQDLVEPIVNVVNYGIASGDIQAGGKVYVHILRFNFMSGGSNKHVNSVIYSSHSASYTLAELKSIPNIHNILTNGLYNYSNTLNSDSEFPIELTAGNNKMYLYTKFISYSNGNLRYHNVFGKDFTLTTDGSSISVSGAWMQGTTSNLTLDKDTVIEL